MIKKYSTAIFLLLILSTFALSSVPLRINYAGRLTDPSGYALSGSYNMRFSISTDSGGNSIVWGPEDHNGVTAVNGVFSVLLGTNSSIAPGVFTGDARYLKVEVASPATSTTYELMTPLTQLVSVGYAFYAAAADTVPDNSITTQKISDEAVTRAKVAAGNFVKRIIPGNNISIADNEGSGTGQVTINAIGFGTGTVSLINSGAGISGGPITSTGTLEVKYDNSTIGLSSGSLEVKDTGIGTGKLANGAVTTLKLSDEAVTKPSYQQ